MKKINFNNNKNNIFCPQSNYSAYLNQTKDDNGLNVKNYIRLQLA